MKQKTAILFISVIFLGMVVVWLAYSLYQGNNAHPQNMQNAEAENANAQKAAEEAAKTQNPFKANNPLVNVETNPLNKTKKVLNPFEQ